MPAPKNKPGTERYRDERRRSGGPRMHGRGWHDQDPIHDVKRVSKTARSAAPEVEAAPDFLGMGRSLGAPKGRSAGRASPRGKGMSTKKQQATTPKSRVAGRRRG